MRLKTLLVRFYKSFNYDSRRLSKSGYKPELWDELEISDGEVRNYPYIKIPIDRSITTIVGANESGKSHLLTAIKKAVDGKGFPKIKSNGQESEDLISTSDFCRYSELFTIQKDNLKYPGLGCEWCDLTDYERDVLKELIKPSSGTVSLDRFLTFRSGNGSIKLYLPVTGTGKYNPLPLDKEQSKSLQEVLPLVSRLESEIALPDSFSIRRLVSFYQNSEENNGLKFEYLGREDRRKFFSEVLQFVQKSQSINLSNFESVAQVQKDANQLINLLDHESLSEKELGLASSLIFDVANVAPEALEDLAKALERGDSGYAGGIIDRVNQQLEASLNLHEVWSQDDAFTLKVEARDFDLVFVIQDKTGTKYSFSERSQGLKFFLSYYVQYRAHKNNPGKSEIFLMDEPDTYLSSHAQQDLLRIFEKLVDREIESHLTQKVQVVYVTHSPFLIDKNHIERIRVVRKESGSRGTVLVNDIAQYRYEPLRSAFSSLFPETTLIGNLNLIVEGKTDQMLIAAMATHLLKRNTSRLETLDLNHVNIVDAGGASNIPYMAYLAIEKGQDKPIVAILMDGDAEGCKQLKSIEKIQESIIDQLVPPDDEVSRSSLASQISEKSNSKHKRALLSRNLISLISDLEFSDIDPIIQPRTIEDLIPIKILFHCSQRFLGETNPDLIEEIESSSLEQYKESILAQNGSALHGLEIFWQSIHFQLGKSIKGKVGLIGFVVDFIADFDFQSIEANGSGELFHDEMTKMENNFKDLFRKIIEMLDDAKSQKAKRSLHEALTESIDSFAKNHEKSARQEDVVEFLRKLLRESPTSPKERQELEKRISNISATYELGKDLRAVVNGEEYKKLLEQIKDLRFLVEEINEHPSASSNTASDTDEVVKNPAEALALAGQEPGNQPLPRHQAESKTPSSKASKGFEKS